MSRSQIDGTQILPGTITASLLGAAASGVPGSVQINSSGAFSYDANLNWNSSNVALVIGGYPSNFNELPNIEIIGSGTDTAFIASSFDDNDGGGTFVGARAGGSVASPSATASTKTLANLVGIGYSGSAFDSANPGGKIVLATTEQWSPSAHGTSFEIELCQATTLTAYPAIYAVVPAGDNPRVGIGNTTPAYELDVLGSVNVSGSFLVNGVPITVGGSSPYAVGGGTLSIVGSGASNTIGSSNAYAVISGGQSNAISGTGTQVFLGGGSSNTVSSSASQSVLCGGQVNSITADHAFIGAGGYNAASGVYAMILGGLQNIASGQYSFASGYYAQAATNGTFVWADFSSPSHFTSSVANSFIIRAVGGVGIGLTAPAHALDVSGDINTSGVYRSGGTAGVSGTFTAGANTITVTNGIITSIA